MEEDGVCPSTALHECLACVQLYSRVPVLNQNHQHVANLSRSVQIGISIMKGVDGSFKSVYEKLTVQAVSTILVGYHLDLATMADSNHFHDAHEGNVLLSLSGIDFPEIRWHDFGGSYKPAGGLVTPALTADFVGKIERFSDTGINYIRMTHQDFASRLNETRNKCTLVGQEMVLVPLCLRQRAFSLVETMLNADVMDTSAQRKLLEKISLGMPELSQKELWRQFFAGRFVWRIYHAAKNATCKAEPPRNHPLRCGSVSWEALPGPYQQLAVLPALLLVRCKDGKEPETIGSAFKITASVSDAHASAAPLDKGFTSALFCLWKCCFVLCGEVDDLKKALRLELVSLANLALSIVSCFAEGR